MPLIPKVSPGQQWRPDKAPARNAIADTVERVLGRNYLGTGKKGNYVPLPTDVIMIKNDSGAARRQYEVLSLTGSFVLDDVTREQLWLNATVASTAQRLFAVLLEPVKDEGYAIAQVSGVCPALVNVVSASHTRASLIASEDRLTSNMIGPVVIKHKPSGTGEKLCVVNLSNPAAVKLTLKTPSGGISAGNWGTGCDEFTPNKALCNVYTWDESAEKWKELLDGTTNVTEYVYNPSTTAIAGDTLITASTDEDGLLTLLTEDCGGGC